jgi:hypothetical protein
VSLGSTREQAMGRPTGQTANQLAPDGTCSSSTSPHPPNTSPHDSSFIVATLQNLQAESWSHELEDLQHENAHGVMQVTSPVTSSPQSWCPYRQAWEHSPSIISQRHPSPSLECSGHSALRLHPPDNDTPYATTER